MNDDTNPTLGYDDDEDTAETELQGTRPYAASHEDTPTSQRITRVRSQPPQGGHVQPIPGQQRPRPQTGYNRRPPRRPKSSAADSGLYLPWWSLALMLVGVLVVSFGLVGLAYLLGNPSAIFAESTPIIRIITAEPTAAGQISQPTAIPPSTQIIAGGNAPTNLQLTGPTLAPVQFTPTPAPITINRRVMVVDVDEQKLNIRDSANVLESAVLFRADEGQVFVVVEGPLQGDGFTWWRIQDPNDTTRAGWAVANYLAVVP